MLEFELKEYDADLTKALPSEPNNLYNLKKFDTLKTNSIKSLVNPYRVLITYSYNSSEVPQIKKMSHKICGHNFEAFELLKKYPNSLMLIPDDLKMATKIIQAFFIKYKKEEVNVLLPRIVYGRPLFITSKTVIICDGQLPTNVIFRSGFIQFILCSKELYWTKNSSNILGFRPGNKPHIQLVYDGRLGYQTTRYIYEITNNNPNINVRIYDKFKKEINFDLYNPVNTNTNIINIAHTYMIYVTGNCRDITKANEANGIDTIQEVIDVIKLDKVKLSSYTQIEVVIVGINFRPAQNSNDYNFADEILSKFVANGLDVWLDIYPESMLPIANFFDKFKTYIYTPTAKNWDCSSRLIPECKKFNKELLLTKTVKETLDTNLALKYRILDYFPEKGATDANTKTL